MIEKAAAMGTTYHYANLTKREWFATDALGGNGKLSGLGLNLTARAFELLFVGKLGENFRPGPLRTGEWVGDLVAVVGDAADEWLEYHATFTNLDADVIVLVHDHGGHEQLGEAAERDTPLFMQMCHLVVTRQALQLQPLLVKRFGPKFLRRYKESCEQWHLFKPRDLARPGPEVSEGP